MYSNIGHLLWNEFWEVLGRSPSGALLGQHDDLSARLVLLHAAMGLSDLVEVEGFADLDAQCARSDLLDQILERRPHEIFRFASIGGQADRSRDSLHWGEIVEGPFVADNAGHAYDAALLGATQRVFERSCAHQFKHFVDSLRTDFLNLFSDRAGIDKHLVDAAGPQQFFAVRVASRRGDEGAVAFSDGRGRQTNRGGAAADQQTLAFFETKRLEQRAPSRLQHFRDGSERFPGKFGSQYLHLCRGHASEFGVPAVELPSHAAHSGRDDIALAKLASRR